MRIDVDVHKLHVNQDYILKNSKRFNVISCGRRFGKTELAVYIIVLFSIINKNFKFAYYAPTYKMLNEVWKELVTILRPIISKKDENLMQIILINGSVIDFWSLDNFNSSRGRKYKMLIIDEASSVRNLKDAWELVLRALLTDYKGRAFFMSTPKGFYNYFYELFNNSKKNKDWASFQMPSTANPYIDASEIDEIRGQLPLGVFQQEYLAEFVNFERNLFAEKFDYVKHVGKYPYNPLYPVYLSFDFNVTSSCIAMQRVNGKTYYIREYHQKGFDLEGLVTMILADFPKSLIYITGDATGQNRSAFTSGNVDAYTLIKNYGNFVDNAFNVPTINPSHINSRVQTNSLLSKDYIYIDESCKLLIKDFEMVVCGKNGEIDKSDSELTHLLDCFRYHLWTWDYGTFKNTFANEGR